MFKKQEYRIVMEIFLGIVISVIMNFLFITYGYFKIRSLSLSSYNVQIFGISIYKIYKNGNYGSPVISNMMFGGVIISIILVIISELLISKKKVRKND